ncbi:unnamed protein product [Bursaphelenchus xylophilus]|uniref:X-box-binding protein 1 n=1 Tax=Bursaphelenchus xylophilus TaxID=6326 RepID=A0A1I7RQD2_BURXY|nr:unnamed protein product [Bursaphelenchus xylophilus]CAG9104392.1 unnamed protein product [Bursaphelenchus xylophilus]
MAKLYLIQNQTLVPATLVAPVRVNPARQTKAPLPVEKILEDPDVLLKPQKTNNQPRRRERLTHLTPEEKLNRRKMKNREAAQNARDRKKEQGKQMEDVLRQLAAENKKLRNENAKLKAQVARLSGQRSSYSSASTELDLPASPDSAYASSSTSALSPVSSTNSSTGYQPVVYYDNGPNQALSESSHYSLSASQSPEPSRPIVPSDDRSARLPATAARHEEMVPEPFEGAVGHYVEVYADDAQHAAEFDEFGRVPAADFDFQPCTSYENSPSYESGKIGDLNSSFEAGYEQPQEFQTPSLEFQDKKEGFAGLPAFDDLVQSDFLDELCSELEIYPAQEESTPYLNDIDMDSQNLFDWCDNM